MLKTVLTSMLALLGLTNAYNLNTNYFPPSKYFCTKFDNQKTTDYFLSKSVKPILPSTWNKVSEIGDCNIKCKPCNTYASGTSDITFGFSAECNHFNDHDVNKLNLLNYTENYSKPIKYPNYNNQMLELISSPITKDGVYVGYPIDGFGKNYISKYTICIKSVENHKVKIIAQSSNIKSDKNNQNRQLNELKNNQPKQTDTFDDDDFNNTNITNQSNQSNLSNSSVSSVILSRMATNTTFNQSSSPFSNNNKTPIQQALRTGVSKSSIITNTNTNTNTNANTVQNSPNTVIITSSTTNNTNNQSDQTNDQTVPTMSSNEQIIIQLSIAILAVVVLIFMIVTYFLIRSYCCWCKNQDQNQHKYQPVKTTTPNSEVTYAY